MPKSRLNLLLTKLAQKRAEKEKDQELRQLLPFIGAGASQVAGNVLGSYILRDIALEAGTGHRNLGLSPEQLSSISSEQKANIQKALEPAPIPDKGEITRVLGYEVPYIASSYGSLMIPISSLAVDAAAKKSLLAKMEAAKDLIKQKRLRREHIEELEREYENYRNLSKARFLTNMALSLGVGGLAAAGRAMHLAKAYQKAKNALPSLQLPTDHSKALHHLKKYYLAEAIGAMGEPVKVTGSLLASTLGTEGFLKLLNRPIHENMKKLRTKLQEE